MFLHIAVPRPLDEAFIYRCPPELEGQVSVGKRVIIPFGRQKVTGYIIDTSTTLPPTLSHKIGKKEIKPIDSILDAVPLMDETILSLCRWASEYYLFPLGMALKTALSGIPEEKELKAPKKRHDVLEIFKEEPGRISKVPASLTAHQEEALLKIRGSIEKGDFGVYLLHGITGSGKTEVYMCAIEQVVKKGKGGIVLVPEIAI
ncbi:MAG TPA: DEAD/DEAH box helicase family protein, partial [Thermodesulfovibrionales bacterium]|nr:DEAD/DEAH box helicase family protein [Thermodesulfovibrionales bacterium]